MNGKRCEQISKIRHTISEGEYRGKIANFIVSTKLIAQFFLWGGGDLKSEPKLDKIPISAENRAWKLYMAKIIEKGLFFSYSELFGPKFLVKTRF